MSRDEPIGGGESLEELEAELLLLEGLLEEEGEAVPEDGGPELRPVPREPEDGEVALPLSFSQERLWFLDRLEPGSAAYNIPAALRLEGPLSVPALSAVLDEVVRRHEVLRTRFRERDGRPEQLVEPAAPVPLPLVDLSRLPPEIREARLQAAARAEARRPFDLEWGPVLRALLLRLGREEHAILLTVHHIASDGWSTGVLVGEVGTLYDATRRGRPSPLPELPVQYGDFAAWQRRRLAGGRLEGELDHWRRRLAGLPPLLELPTDRPRTARRSYRGERLGFEVPRPVAKGLAELARSAGATPFMTLLAAFGALLAHASGQEDLAVGTAVAGRPKRELEGLVGFFVNTLVLRLESRGEWSFRDLLARVRDVALDAFGHQEVPFERLVEELAPERSLSHAPLFQVMFGFDNAPESEPGLGELRLSPVRSGADTNKFDLSLAMVESGGRFGGTLSYARDLFDRATVEALLDRFQRLLAAVAEDPGRRLDHIDLLFPEERRQLLAAAGRGVLPEELPPVLDRIRRVARERPRAVAVVATGHRLTYGELDRRSTRLAGRLVELGAGPGTAVALWLDRGAGFLVAALAAWHAGAFYLPLEDSLPPERAETLLAATGARVLVADGDRGEGVGEGLGVHRLRIDRAEDWEGAAPPPPLEGAARSLAYVLFTSGSTGVPKGVAVEHRQLAAYLEGITAHLGGEAGRERWALVSTFAADLGLTAVLPALTGGGELHVLSRDELSDPERTAEVVRREGIEAMKIVPSHLAALLSGPDPAAVLPARRLVFGGEALSPDLLATVRRLAPELAIHNHYGPTETTVGVLATRLGPPWPREAGPAVEVPPLGRPLGASRVYVVDRRLGLRPTGAPGELVVGGPQVARGYLGRAAATAERFVPDPFAAQAGSRLYRTGDRVRWGSGGDVEFLGRIDQQLKVRGFRVEPGEVEAALAAVPGVEEAVVVAVGEGSARSLAGYWVPSPPSPPSEAELREALRRRLPDWMVPTWLVPLERLPLTPNGKVDRRALPAPAAAPAAAGEPPSGWLEEVVAGVWEEVLEVPEVGRRSDFFALGGHSLLATRVVSRVRRAVGAELELRTLFEAPVLAAFAERVGDALHASRGVVPPPLVPSRETGPRPLSFSQERLWFLDRLEPGRPTYNVPRSVRLVGPLSVAALDQAVDEVERRHQVLRSRYLEVDGEPLQAVVSGLSRSMPVVDLSRLSPAAAEALLRRLAAEEARRPFDLETGPVQRRLLVRVDRHDHGILLTQHHVASDAWSAEILMGELSALYPAWTAGAPSPLPELPVQYGDYAAWQRGWLQGEVLEKEVEWWRRELEGLPPVLDLPTDRPRPPVQSWRGASAGLSFGAGDTEALRALARQLGATPFMVLLAAFQALLARYAGEQRFAVGTPVAGRTRLELEPLIGFFVNTLVLRAEVGGGSAMRNLVESVRDRSLSVHAHQELPFEKLVQELSPQRNLGHSPLFQVMFVYQGGRATGAGSAASPGDDPRSLGGLEVRPLGGGTPAAKFDLTLAATDVGERIALSLEYATDLFDRTTAERLLGHLERLVSSALSEPERPVSTLPLSSPSERHKLVAEWGRGAQWRDGAGDGSIPSRFLSRARSEPGAVALSWDGGSRSYGELASESARLASWLVSRGVVRGDRVAVCVERSPELVVSLLAILRAGAAYVALEPDYPAQRLEYLLEDSRSRLLLVDRSTAGRLPGGVGPERVELAAALEESAGASPPAGSLPSLCGEDLAYVAYTSGSTGRPKGVAVAHRGVVRLAEGGGHARLDGETSFLMLAPVSFDASTLEIWGPLLSGGRVAVPPAGRLALEEVGSAVARSGVTSLWLTAGLFHLMVDEHPEGLAPLRELLAGGDVLSPDHVRRLLARHPQLRLVNGYGPTENTTFTTAHPFAAAPEAGGSASLGRPIGGTTAYVVDRALRLAPAGVAGELVTGGAGVARGYLGRPGRTAASFVPDPFSSAPGARLYRTGDRVRWRPDGRLEFLGRLDQQVKVRGFRIEPGEVETVLASLPGVREAAVVARGEGAGDKVLVGYWVADGAAPAPRPTPEALRAVLRERLPDWMVPAHLVELESLPLTPNGKVDRKALPAPQEALEPEVLTPPAGPVEETVAAVWQEALGVSEVGRESDFFALGGHSLLATRVVSRLRRELGVEVELRVLFEAPSLAGFAARVAASEAQASAPPLVPVDRRRPLPLSFAQERLWFLDRLEPGSSAYNIPRILRLPGAVGLAALEQVLAEVERRHEVLRTRFVATGGEPRQAVQEAVPRPVPVVDLSGLSEADRRRQRRRLAREEARRPFDLARGPVQRACLLHEGPQEPTLLLTQHHIVSDGWSMGILERELAALHRAWASGLPSLLPELPVQYADYAVWQRSWLSGERLEAEVEWWRRELAGLPPVLELPTDRPRPAVRSPRAGLVEVRVDREVTEAVRGLARHLSATPFVVLLAAFQTLLWRHGDQDRFAVGSPVAGRNRVEIEPLVGFFVNTLVLRADVDGREGFADRVRSARERTLAAQDHQELPFEKLVQELAPQRSLSHSPLFQVMLTYQEVPTSDGEGVPATGGSPASASPPVPEMAAGSGDAKFDLTLGLTVRRGCIVGGLSYAADLFDEATVRGLGERLERLLAAATAEPERPLAELPLLSEAERHQLLVEWSGCGSAAPPPAGSPPDLWRLVVERAAAQPKATALAWKDGAGRGGSWSHAELTARAAAFAHHLRGLGVGPEARVGVLLERTPELVVAVLGVLGAGGAYVPLDPAYPRSRVELMLEDGGVAVLVAEPGRLADLDLPAGVTVVERRDDGTLPGATAGPAAVSPGDLGPPSPGHLAYVIYTSGSTGRPKGVAIEHRAAVALAGWTQERYGAEELAGVLAATSICFDLSVYELFATLGAGGTVVLAPNALELPSVARHHRVTLVNTVPSAMAELVRSGGVPDSVRTVNLAGEALPRELADGVYGLGHVERLYNLYGPSEDTTYSTEALVPAADPGRPRIGRPLPGGRAYVVDRSLRPVPPGVAGELLLGGVGLARGYLGRPSLTASRWLPDPFSGEPGARLYRTGDRVRWVRARAEGGPAELDFLGRLDHQVKVRGFRIEPGEIETVLANHPGVQEAVVLARPAAAGDLALAAYWVAREPAPADADAPGSGTPGTDALRTWLGERLPAHMVPAHLVELESLPLTPNGKVDRKALAALDPAVPSGGERVAPRDPLEKDLADLWAGVLGLDEVGVEDDFFALGGHSLLAVRLVAGIEERAGLRLPVATLFRGATVARVADLVRRGDVRREPLLALRPGGAGRPLFLVHAAGGGGLIYLPLARRLPPGVPLLAAQDPALDRSAPSLGPGAALDLAELAAEHVAAVRERQPEGPYRLAGWSLGGRIAFEMGRQLEAAGEEVELLALIDSPAPPPQAAGTPVGAGGSERRPDRRRHLEAFADVLGVDPRSLGLSAAEMADLQELPVEEALRRLLDRARQAGALPPGSGDRDLVALFHRVGALLAAGDAWRPTELRRGPTAVLRATGERRLQGVPEDLGWRPWCSGPLVVAPVPGDHLGVLTEPAVGVLAERLADLLGLSRRR